MKKLILPYFHYSFKNFSLKLTKKTKILYKHQFLKKENIKKNDAFGKELSKNLKVISSMKLSNEIFYSKELIKNLYKYENEIDCFVFVKDINKEIICFDKEENKIIITVKKKFILNYLILS